MLLTRKEKDPQENFPTPARSYWMLITFVLFEGFSLVSTSSRNRALLLSLSFLCSKSSSSCWKTRLSSSSRHTHIFSAINFRLAFLESALRACFRFWFRFKRFLRSSSVVFFPMISSLWWQFFSLPNVSKWSTRTLSFWNYTFLWPDKEENAVHLASMKAKSTGEIET